jgi:hypothetical protein
MIAYKKIAEKKGYTGGTKTFPLLFLFLLKNKHQPIPCKGILLFLIPISAFLS